MAEVLTIAEPEVVAGVRQRVVDRYPGRNGHPYLDSPEHHSVFFGRPLEIDEVVNRVRAARLVVLYGRSGLGKTSLLQAGVFAKLREARFLPVVVRIPADGTPFLDSVLYQLDEAVNDSELELVAGERCGLWEFFKTSLVWRGTEVLTPVLVFDQFEEIFGLAEPARNEIATEIGALACGTVPSRLRGTAGRESALRLSAEPPALKVIISLREEDFGALQELTGTIPGLFQERIRLTPLTREAASAVVRQPATLEDTDLPAGSRFAVPPFTWQEDAVKAVLDFASSESEAVETFTLSQVLAHVERDVVPHLHQTDGKPIVTKDDLGGRETLSAVIDRFYIDTLESITDSAERGRARRLCEEGLLLPNGRRRSLEESEIRERFRVGDDTLEQLQKQKLIRCERRLGGKHYEIVHDRLAESIVRVRKPPIWLKRYKRDVPILLLVVVILLVAAAILGYTGYRVTQARDQAERLVSFLIGEELLEQLRPLGRTQIMTMVQNGVGRSLRRGDTPRAIGNHAVFVRNGGDLLFTTGNVARAEASYREAEKSFRALLASSDADPLWTIELARTLGKLGGALAEQGRVAAARTSYEEAVELWTTANAQGGGENVLTAGLAGAYSELGEALSAQGEYESALKAFERTIAAVEPLARVNKPELQHLKVFHQGLDGAAFALGRLGDADSSRAHYERALAIADRMIAEYPFAADAQISKAIATNRLANLIFRRDSRAALQQFQQMFDTIDALVRWDPENRRWARDRAMTLNLLSAGYRMTNQLDQAEPTAQSALELMKDLVAQDPGNAKWKSDLADMHRNYGTMLARDDNTAAAAGEYGSARQLYEQVIAIDPTNAEHREDLAVLYLDWAGALIAAEKVPFYARFRDTYAELARAHPGNAGYLNAVGKAELFTGDALRNAGDAAGATNAFAAALSPMQSAIELAPAALVYRTDLAWLYERIANVASSPEGELAALESMERCARDAADRWPNAEVLAYQLYWSQRRIGEFRERQGDIGGARDAYRRALESARESLRLATGVDKFERERAENARGGIEWLSAKLAQ